MRYGLQFRDVFAAWESLLDGVYITLLLSASAMLGGLTIGVVCAAARVYGPRWLKGIAAGYVEIIRNTPLLVQLFLIFFGLLAPVAPKVGSKRRFRTVDAANPFPPPTPDFFKVIPSNCDVISTGIGLSLMAFSTLICF
jgi:His/Glu/Gln/Arg/opine family amino acid ABC transporter permease subunit